MADQKKILIIEDDKFLGKMLSRMLESSDFKVELAATGKEGVEKAADTDASLILLDIMLPDLDGFDVLKQIKASPKGSAVPVIILSNLGQTEDVNQGKQLGATDYIVKSDFSLDEIIGKVREYVR